VKKRIVKYIFLILSIPAFINASDPIIVPPETAETKVRFTYQNNDIQFSKKYAFDNIDNSCDAYVCDVALSVDETTHEMSFFIMVSYIRCDEEYARASFLYDGYDFLPYCGSNHEFMDNLFEMRMFQWFWYMKHGFSGFMYIPEYYRKVPIKIPSYVFQQIDANYELWKRK
jgi:hypothetical protein